MQPDFQTPNPPPPAYQPVPEPKTSIIESISAFFSHWFISWIVIPGGMVLLLHFYVFSAYHVVGSSMTPTMHNSDYLIVSKVDKTIAAIKGEPYIPKRNQIIVFHYPKQPELDFVKRVVGLPGERVVVKDCKVTVYNTEQPNGFNPDLTHEISGTCTEGEEFNGAVPNKTIFVLGDNRMPGGSSDSREWGFLPSYDIVGNAVLRLYPLDGFRIF
ncbi:MAG TPA: signal peptidase I [Candidatus Saccharimonadia bacterium]